MMVNTKSRFSNTITDRKPFLAFSIDRILGLESGHKSSHLTEQCCSDNKRVINSCIENVRANNSNERLKHLCQYSIDKRFSNSNDDNHCARYQWLQCTRYHPPKLQRSKKKCAPERRKLDRKPRVPFTQHQLTVLEEKFGHTHYLSSIDVAELSASLNMTEIRVKIWFQNRRARYRREMEAELRNHTTVVHKSFQPLSVPQWPGQYHRQ